ncbi:MAG: ABC transporter substrate-binding protein [Acidimicrobiia bacterium]|nr:ABC transporter substrate-binding protein [Acidimicrobiia bacterium]
MKPTMKALARMWVVLLLVLGVATGCGSDADTVSGAADAAVVESDDSGAADEPDDADAAGEESSESEDPAAAAASKESPSRIVSLSPTATEMLYAIGAGEQVVAVDLYSNYPAEAPDGTLDGFVPDLEAIVATEPDLVVTQGLPADVETGLTELGITVLTQPAAASLDDVYAQIADLGVATGQMDGAADTNAEIRAGVDAVLSGLPERDEPLTVFHEIDESFYTATSNTFIGQVYTAMGLKNIADPHDDGTGYPLIDGETIIAANPDVIVYTSQVPYDAEAIADRPGWDSISAVANGRIVEVDADIASRWGPRIVEFMEAIAESVA